MANTLELIVKARDDASGVLRGIDKKLGEVGLSVRKVGIAMAASGAAITGALGFMGKAAIDEEINIKRLAITINNSGIAYDSVKDSLEALIATTQRKTGIADNEQRDILNRLILVTNDYNTALGLLPTVLDLAAAGEMDAATAATYLGKAYLDLEEGAEEVSVRFGQASLQFKSMEDIQNRVRGSAEALKNPLLGMKNAISDVAEAIGANLIPMLKSATEGIEDMSIAIQIWTKEYPELAKVLTLGTAGLGVLLTIFGTLTLIVPGAITFFSILAGVIAFFGTTAGIVTAAVGALAGAGIYLWQNWEDAMILFRWIWRGIQNIFTSSINFIMERIEDFVNSWIWAINTVTGAINTFLNWIPGLTVNIGVIGELAIPRMAQGGIVPGPIGQPIPVIAHGGERFAGIGGSFGGETINVYVAGSVISERDLLKHIREEFIKIKNRNVTIGF